MGRVAKHNRYVMAHDHKGEVAFATQLFEEVEDGLRIARRTDIATPEGEDVDPVVAQIGLEEFTASSVVVVGKDDGLPVRLDGSMLMRLNPGGQGAMKQSFLRKIERVVE